MTAVPHSVVVVVPDGPRTTLSHAVVVHPEVSVCAFTPAEYFQVQATLSLSQVDEDGRMKLVLIRKGATSVVRGHRVLTRTDIERAVQEQWHVSVVTLDVQPQSVYEIVDIEEILGSQPCDRRNEVLEAAEGAEKYDVVIEHALSFIRPALETYFAGL